MMPEMIVQPKMAQAMPGKGTTGAKSVKLAMQKASDGGEPPQQVAPATAGPVQKKASTEAPVQFFELLMAQIEAPVQVAVVAAQGPEGAGSVGEEGDGQVAAAVVQKSPEAETQVVIPQAVTPTATASNQAVSQGFSGGKAVVGASDGDPSQPQVIQSDVTQGQAETYAANPVQKQQDGAGPQQRQIVSSAPVAAAQVVAEPIVKNAVQASDKEGGEAPKAFQSAPKAVPIAQTVATSAPEKTPVAATVSAKVEAKSSTKTTVNSVNAAFSGEVAIPTKQTHTSDFADLLQGSQAGVTAVRHEGAVNVGATAQQAAGTQTNSEAAANLRQLADQVSEGVRSAVGSDRTLTITLNPPELGRVFIRMEEDNGSVNAVLKVENPVTRADIEQTLPSIVRSLEQSGIQVRRMDVLPSDPVPQQEGSFTRNYDMHGGMPGQREQQQNSSAQGSPAAGGPWQELQPAASSGRPASTISDSAINIYV